MEVTKILPIFALSNKNRTDMKKIFSINVPGRHGYSFAVKCDDSYDEDSVINAALEANLFEDETDADYAIAEDITDFSHDVKHFEDCTYEI